VSNPHGSPAAVGTPCARLGGDIIPVVPLWKCDSADRRTALWYARAVGIWHGASEVTNRTHLQQQAVWLTSPLAQIIRNIHIRLGPETAWCLATAHRQHMDDQSYTVSPIGTKPKLTVL
jgi:hypothetical protein